MNCKSIHNQIKMIQAQTVPNPRDEHVPTIVTYQSSFFPSHSTMDTSNQFSSINRSGEDLGSFLPSPTSLLAPETSNRKKEYAEEEHVPITATSYGSGKREFLPKPATDRKDKAFLIFLFILLFLFLLVVLILEIWYLPAPQ